MKVSKPKHKIDNQIDLPGLAEQRIEQPGRFVVKVAVSDAAKYSNWLLSRMVFNFGIGGVR